MKAVAASSAPPSFQWGPPARVKYAGLLATVLILAAFLLVYCHGYKNLGLYEDDYVSVAKAINVDWGTVADHLSRWAVAWPRGRPLGNGCALLLPFILNRVGGLTAIYVLPIAAVTLNAVLIFTIVRRHAGSFAGFVSGLTFALLPTDTMRLSLHATPELQFAITFLLLGFLAYSSGRSWLCYLCLVVGMLFHESATLSFLAIPLLDMRATREFARRWGVHVLLCVFGIGLVLGLRRFVLHEERSREVLTDPFWMLRRMIASLLFGGYTHVRLLFTRARETLTHADPLWAALVLLLAGMVVAAYLLWRDDRTLRQRGNAVMALAAVAAFTFAVPYLAYTTDPYWPGTTEAGRMATVHTASGVGVALAAGAAAAGLLAITRRHGFQQISVASLAVYLGLLLGFGHVVEQQYQQAWRNQRAFWGALLPQIGDIRDHTIIFVERNATSDYPFTWMILSNSWADSIMLRSLYKFPGMDREPRVFFVDAGWERDTKTENGRVMWYMPVGEWLPGWVELEPHNVIVFRSAGGMPGRVAGRLRVRGGEIPLALSSVPGEPAFPHQPFYHYLIR